MSEQIMHKLSRRAVLRGSSLAFAAAVGSRAAASVAEFYRGTTLSLVIGLAPVASGPIAHLYRRDARTIAFGPSFGDDYDIRGRLLARHMGRHIPGAPTIVTQNMPGAGGLTAANWLATQAPRDGTALLLLTQGIPVIQAIGGYALALDVRRCHWIGNTLDNPNVVTAWHGRGVHTVAEAKQHQLIVGATWRGSETYVYPAMMNTLIGTRFRIVLGYADDIDLNIALERGEIGGRVAGWAAWKTTRPAWIAEGRIDILAQSGLWRHPELPAVPLIAELARNEGDRQVLRFLTADSAIARALVTTEGVPPARVAALRLAFERTVRDPAFLADARRANIVVSPVSAAKAQRVAALIVDTPPATVARTRRFFAK